MTIHPKYLEKSMSVYEIIRKRRSVRRFLPKPISRSILEKIVDAGRLSPSGANKQPLEFVVVDSPALLPVVFAQTKWAAYLPPDIGFPPQGQRPTAYIVVLVNFLKSNSSSEHDAGAAIENMILTALEDGVGSCWIGSLDRVELKRILQIPDHCEIDSVLALGYPNEKPVMVDLQNSIEYWRDEQGVHFVPKRRLQEVMHFNKY